MPRRSRHTGVPDGLGPGYAIGLVNGRLTYLAAPAAFEEMLREQYVPR